MKQVTILDRSELRRLPTEHLDKVLQTTEHERTYSETRLNSDGLGMKNDEIERIFYRIKKLDTFIKNIKNEIKDRYDA